MKVVIAIDSLKESLSTVDAVRYMVRRKAHLNVALKGTTMF